MPQENLLTDPSLAHDETETRQESAPKSEYFQRRFTTSDEDNEPDPPGPGA